jgi:hypothetical protein
MAIEDTHDSSGRNEGRVEGQIEDIHDQQIEDQQIEDIHDLDGAVLIQSVMRCGVSGV